MAMELMKEFELLEFCHVQKKKNDKADAFAKLVAALAAPLVAEHKSLYMTGSFFLEKAHKQEGRIEKAFYLLFRNELSGLQKECLAREWK